MTWGMDSSSKSLSDGHDLSIGLSRATCLFEALNFEFDMPGIDHLSKGVPGIKTTTRGTNPSKIYF